MLEDTPDDPDIPYLIAGNYSELVTEQVEYILDHNPELEAIAFANDNMAKAGYRVCAARDLLVGYDIDHAKTMGTTTDQRFPQQLPVQLPGITECAYALSGKEATILPDVSHFSPEKLLRLPAAHRLYHTASYQHGTAA